MELLNHEEVHAVVFQPEDGFDTGNVLSWLEANMKLALESSEWGPALRESMERMLAE